jgi:phosphoserine aminotransferase
LTNSPKKTIIYCRDICLWREDTFFDSSPIFPVPPCGGEVYPNEKKPGTAAEKSVNMDRVFNFSAGPSVLPEKVLQIASSEMLNYHGSGQSVMEMSHRSNTYQEIIDTCEANLRKVMNIPENYKVLFLQGGAASQFGMVPMNLMNKNNKADFVVTGQWAKKAFAEAKRYGAAREVASSADKTFSYIPKLDPSTFDPEADYFHICLNNTIYGTKFYELPETGNVPLVADVSSCILSEPIDVSKFGLLYAGAQKNMGPAGLTVVIIREDLIGNAMEITPTMYNYQIHADNGSMYNTPPCYSIYVCKLVLDWLLEDIGGLEKMKEINEHKAKILYDFLDSSAMFHGTVEPSSRSIMNVPFITGDEALDKKFVSEATAAGFVNLKGHRSVGGMRASIYNAMPTAGVEKLVEFMAKFEADNK